jgi:hypothetical protein
MLAVILLICVAVIVTNAAPAPYASWVAILLATLALLIAIFKVGGVHW